MRAGGAAGTGVGAGNEFILSNASAKAGPDAGPVGTSGAAATAYELTGSGEGQAAQFVGKRVEIIGKLKAAETSASGKPKVAPRLARRPVVLMRRAGPAAARARGHLGQGSDGSRPAKQEMK